MKNKSTHNQRLDKLRAVCRSIESREQLDQLKNYCNLFIEQSPDDKLAGISDQMLAWMRESPVFKKLRTNTK